MKFDAVLFFSLSSVAMKTILSYLMFECFFLLSLECNDVLEFLQHLGVIFLVLCTRMLLFSQIILKLLEERGEVKIEIQWNPSNQDF